MTAYFIVRIWFGIKGSGPDGSFKFGLLLMIAITSYMNVLREVLSSLCADLSRIAVRTLLLVLICLSQMPPM